MSKAVAWQVYAEGGGSGPYTQRPLMWAPNFLNLAAFSLLYSQRPRQFECKRWQYKAFYTLSQSWTTEPGSTMGRIPPPFVTYLSDNRLTLITLFRRHSQLRSLLLSSHFLFQVGRLDQPFLITPRSPNHSSSAPTIFVPSSATVYLSGQP